MPTKRGNATSVNPTKKTPAPGAGGRGRGGRGRGGRDRSKELPILDQPGVFYIIYSQFINKLMLICCVSLPVQMLPKSPVGLIAQIMTICNIEECSPFYGEISECMFTIVKLLFCNGYNTNK